MKVLIVHAYYQQPGGEDRSVEAAAKMLEDHGHEVRWLKFDNAEIEGWSKLRTAASLMWNSQSYRQARALMRSFRPDLMHVQNIFPALSPSVYWAARAEGVPIVQKLSNYRMFCVNGLLFRDGQVCESCLGKPVAWHGIRHRCYRGSRVMSAGVTASYAAQRVFGTWSRHIDAYIALDGDGRDRYIEAGLDPERIFVKPEVLDEMPLLGSGDGGFAIFAGRLSPEKGLDTLVDAWQLDASLPALRIAGDGPLADLVRDASVADSRITWLGRLSADALADQYQHAALAVVPSKSYETFGRAAMEAMAAGTPVVAARHGALRNVVADGISGRHFMPGNAEDLVRAVRTLQGDIERTPGLRQRVRGYMLGRYDARDSYITLMRIYESVLSRANAA